MRQFESLRTKFTRTMLLVTGLVGLLTLAIVVFTSTQASQQQLTLVERSLHEGITSKGKVLTENQALALRGLTLDNAFLDMQALVERAVTGDSDLFYGLYVNSQGQTLAYTRRGAARSGERGFDEQSHRELGLQANELLVKSSQVRRTNRLGKDLLEVAVPVVAEDGEIIGTIRYGLSTARMHEALARARDQAQAQLERSLWVMGSLLTLALLVGALVTRTQGAKITRPVTELTLAAQSLAAGDRSVRVRIDSGDELELLGTSFNRMVEDLDASYGTLEEMNRTLEQKVALRTSELARKNRDMRLVLDNVDQGFATLSANGVMAIERSRVVTQWFGACDEPVPFWTYIEETSPEFALQFRLAWEQVEEDVLPLEASLSQLPAELTVAGSTFSFRYLPFGQVDDELEGVLVVIADVTERLVKAREDAEHGELVQLFKMLTLDRAGMDTFIREANVLVDAVCSGAGGVDRLLLQRRLHTLKGNAASVGLGIIAALCHDLESQLAESERMSPKTVSDLSARWSTLCQHAAELTGRSVDKVIEVPAAEYGALVSRLSADPQFPAPVLEQVLGWRLEPLARSFQRLGEHARALARRLGRGEIEVEIEASGLRVDPERFNPLFSDLIHLVRNAVDHGLETPEERSRAGKPPAGKLSFVARAGESGLVLELSDDGRGIDWAAIRRDAERRGLPRDTASELLQALCHDGVTTRDTVSAVSGRGVGMGAVKQRVEALAGRLEVRSTQGAGTTWILSFPAASPEVSALKPRARALARIAGRGAEGRG